KTHLMHAVGHYVLQHDRNLKLTYISSERFMNEMINAVRYDRVIDFRERYRTVDVLLVDDIQFLAGKEGTQTEFFHTFNALYDSQKQIVLSSDCPPHEIPQLEERLRSRFEWGLTADIQSPDLETKFVADYYNLKLVDLKSRNNSKSIAWPRQIAMYLCKSLTHASLPEIGRSFGGKHHSTVIHSIRKVEDLRKKDGDFNTLIGNFLEGFR